MAGTACAKHFKGEISDAAIKVSHPIIGRTYEAWNKAKKDLKKKDITVYYERLAFAIELPGYKHELHGREMTLTVAGVKAYNLDNLGSKRTSGQTFKIGIGWNVDVCTNLCIFGTNYKSQLQVGSVEALEGEIDALLKQFDGKGNLEVLRKLGEKEMNEEQFAKFLGRSRMYHVLPATKQKQLPRLELNDTQVSAVAKGYYSDKNFAAEDKVLNMWSFYNLLTGAAASSFLDKSLDKNANAMEITQGVIEGMDGKGDYQWYLN